MAKVIGLSGPQGGGKTTLLNSLREMGFEVDDFKVSRQVQAELGWDSLDNVLTDVDTMREFQTKVRDVKLAREKANWERNDVEYILTERTFADIASYTQLWSWELVQQGKWSIFDAVQFTAPFVSSCAKNQVWYQGNIILPSMPHVQWQDDPHRAKHQHTGFVSNQLDKFFGMKHPKNIRTFTVTKESVQDRAQQTYDWIKTL